VRGSIVAYATDVKSSLVGVDSALLASQGAVNAEVATQMARGARELLGASIGVATTGVAGPDVQDGAPVGTVFVAVSTPQGERCEGAHFVGDRDDIRRAACDLALELIANSVPRE
jgi:nicotinamide-nucleotide amidase